MIQPICILVQYVYNPISFVPGCRKSVIIDYNTLTIFSSMQPSYQLPNSNQLKSQRKSLEQSHDPATEDQNIKSLPPTMVTSQFYDTYIKYLDLQGSQGQKSQPYHHNKNYQQKVEQLLRNDINISFRSQFSDTLQMRIIKCTRDSIQIGLSWGFIYCQVFVIKLGIKGQRLHGTNVAGKGSFSTAYFTQFNKNTYITKSIPIAYNNNLESILQSPQLNHIIIEYFISLLAGLLEVGPKIQRLFGFDIVLYNDCADYVLEACQSLAGITYHVKNVEEELKYGLKILHSLRICHCDIKPDNIMYCPRLKRVVFVDFGLARVIRQDVGYKSLTYFLGTYLYSGQQMRRLYVPKLQKHIDMYFNDVESLKLTLNYLEKKITNANEIKELLRIEDLSESEDKDNQQFTMIPFPLPQVNKTQYLINILNIKYNLFLQNFSAALILLRKQKVMMKSAMVLLVEGDNYAKNIFFSFLATTGVLGEVRAKVSKLFNRYCTFDREIAQYLEKYYAQQYICDVIGLMRQSDTNTASYKDGLLKITNMLNPMEDFVNSQNSVTCPKMRQKIINNAYKQLYPEVKVGTQVSFQYKSHVVLTYFLSLSRKIHSQNCLENLRWAFIEIDDYISCLQADNEIIRVVGQTSLSWFYVIRMYYFIQRRKWMSSAYQYGDRQWYHQIQNKTVSKGDGSFSSSLQILENLLRSIALLILSFQFSEKALSKIEEANDQLIMALSLKFGSIAIYQKLLLIQSWCTQILASLKTKSLPAMKFWMQQLQETANHPWGWMNCKTLKNDFVNKFTLMSKFYIGSETVYQFKKMITRNINKIENKLQVLYLIERIVRDYKIVNSYVKVELFRLYVQIIIGIDIKLLGNGTSVMVIQNLMTVFIEGIRELIDIKQNEAHLPNFELSFYDKFKEDIAKFYLHLMQVISTCNDRSQISQTLMIITKAYMKYLESGINVFQKYLLDESLSLAKDQEFMSNNHSGLLQLLRQLKQLYIMLSRTEPLLEKLILMFFHQIVANKRLQIILGVPEIFLVVLSIQARATKLIKKYFPIFLQLTKSISQVISPLINGSLQFMYRETIAHIIFGSEPNEIRQVLDDFCMKLSLKSVGQNYFYSIIVPYVYSISVQLPDVPTAQERRKMMILTIFGVDKFKCKNVYVQVMTFIFKQVRKLQAIGTRKNVELLRKQIKIFNQESIKKLENLCYKNINLTKKQRYSDLNLVLREKLENKLKILKENIKTSYME